MKKKLFALCIMLLMLSVYGFALANAAEPPGLTVIINNPPEGLKLSLQLNNEDTAPLVAEHRFWEGQYKFYYHDIPGSKNHIKNAALIVTYPGVITALPVPKEYFGYDKQITLDLETNEIIQGQTPWRAPLLAAMRVILTLIIEGAIFFAFGYRTKQSLLVFLAVNILTQGLLNIAFIGATGYWFILFVLIEIGVFIAESLIYARFLTEHGKKRAVLYALTANAASLFLGGWMISSLPV